MQLEELRAARDKTAANKTGWVEIKPEWFASQADCTAFLIERNHKRRVEILDARINALTKGGEDA
jgi:hypothetical protein